MITTTEERLPLGAVRIADGNVIIPASRRPDGSERKVIRIRQGYVPQDEIAKYKTVAQRRREQQSKCVNDVDDTAVDALPMNKLSLEHKNEVLTARIQPSTDKASRQELRSRQNIEMTGEALDTLGEKMKNHQQQLKRQLTRLNKTLKEIARLEGAKDDLLTAQQKDKILRKSTLLQKRKEIIAELSGDTSTRRNGSVTNPRPKVAITL
ncbi:Uncharacterized conserved protein [Plasmopara halstedii]|uniref:Uncharacterized conserved protein n=1 Tax=Plasmopara halstedii TaxID=4781 RepID=A0A0P1AQW5_PLAHL|nr:Uncharacterized conserved protein [Plasmopara halstedii]CEG43607.1 Uncharacterized conserved protein [Plasmopara halstedii]|eukprot:XP_024579976.1 Uncharacterized conserved protein [Plasmopara halstedii]